MKAEFFKGLSKGLIPSNAIGVDFYIKKLSHIKKVEPLVKYIKRPVFMKKMTLLHKTVPQLGYVNTALWIICE